ncbi:hypothetical protein LCGC14_1974040 [marine sediment metagenome]|uniref:Uncharacterized protein n=1 Tax=marine sediment metagenome TaxID=412755 RepID=A0A0F9I806_9ZZZZ
MKAIIWRPRKESEMKKIWRIKHVPTGFYYCPVRRINSKCKNQCGIGHTQLVRSNLSKTGKIYARRPSLKKLHLGHCSHLTNYPVDSSGVFSHIATIAVIPFSNTDWTIEEWR